MNIIEIEQFLKESKFMPVIDVRSPSEFEKGHISGSVSIPLFNDRERAEVGTIYTKTGRQEAIEKGLDIVGPKMSEFIRKVKKLSPSDRLLVYCWRGGMRSESLAWLFERAGMRCSTLKGGYKAYRSFLLKNIGEIQKLIVIEGNTGSGKTELLKYLKIKGEQIIDLELIANHRGSVFGGIGQPPQPSSQQFQNNLFDSVLQLNRTKRTWIEGESKTIGKVFLPSQLWETMTFSIKFEIIVPLQTRICRLAREYGSFPEDEMEKSIGMLSKRIGEVNKNEILALFREKHFETVAARLLLYYDKLYRKSIDPNVRDKVTITLQNDDIKKNSEILIERAKELGL